MSRITRREFLSKAVPDKAVIKDAMGWVKIILYLALAYIIILAVWEGGIYALLLGIGIVLVGFAWTAPMRLSSLLRESLKKNGNPELLNLFNTIEYFLIRIGYGILGIVFYKNWALDPQSTIAGFFLLLLIWGSRTYNELSEQAAGGDGTR